MSLITAVLSHSILITPYVLGTLFLGIILYRVFLHPLSLSHVPGPLFFKISSFFLYAICYLGIECRVLDYFHRSYKTSILRIAPNVVSISDGAALHQMYVAGGGFLKDARYENFRVAGHETIFSSRDTAYRDVRAKAVSPLFAMGAVRAASEAGGIIHECVDRYIQRFKSEKKFALQTTPKAAKIDILELTYRLFIDSLTGYLFGKVYGAMDEQAVTSVPNQSRPDPGPAKMSALPFIFAIVDAGRFSLLPPHYNHLLNSTLTYLFPSPTFFASLASIHSFASSLITNTASVKGLTYQSRLLATGISSTETIAQCMAVTFAGTDSPAVKLVTIIFHLVRNPAVYERLQSELQASDPSTDPQMLPYLRAVVREGLRLGMANPARFTRLVPAGGFEVGGIHIPAGTNVGAAPYVLHHNATIYPEPFAFRPERWLDNDGNEQGSSGERQKREMERDFIPFGVGLRMCIARNFATHELFVATRAIVESEVLEGARTCTDKIDLLEYFNGAIKDHKLEIEWAL